ncbi:MAG: pyruvate kinase, partial [Solirubrobacterales bacterium]|nr:pyruvate kinase [Solirubrobacterales bacterium]
MAAQTTIEVVMPEMGESVTEGTILEWHCSEGETIGLDDTIVEISTDKVDAEVPSPAAGIVTKILAEEGDTVKVGQVIAEITADPDAVAAAPAADSNGSASIAETNGSVESNGSAAGAAPAAADAGNSNESVSASPIAKRAAADLGVNLGTLPGSGREGRIVKADVLAAANGDTPNGSVSQLTAASAPSATALKGAAAMLAKYMDESRSIPTATSFRTLAVGVLDARRKQLKAAGKKVSFTHIIAWAIALAATDEMPVMAHHFEEVDGNPTRVDDGQVNLGLAVDVEKKDGSRTLMVPVIPGAGQLGFDGFLAAYDALVAKSRDNKLMPADLVGGNMTLTNPGGLGTVASVPRLMQGQGTIIAAGAIGYPAGLDDAAEALGAEKSMTLTSTYDHRIIQGAESGRFLANLDALLQGEQGFYERLFGDLGVELPLEAVPIVQKEAVEISRRWAKPVIVATQVLESMITSPRPTRAEASDCANAVLDGTDAVMLSGETSVGEYPILTVETMARIIESTEDHGLQRIPAL